MTVINAFLRGGTGYILSDGAAVDVGSRVLAGIGSKIIVLPHVPCVVIARGGLMTYPMITMTLWKLVAGPGMDEFASRVAGDLRGELQKYFLAAPQLSDFDMVAVGYCHRRGLARGFFVSSTDLHQSPAWEVVETGSSFVMPGAESLLQVFTDLDAIDPSRDGVRLMQAQREFATPLGCSVGGFVQLTKVSPYAITTSIIGRWDDVVGETIAPEKKAVSVRDPDAAFKELARA